MYNLKLSNAHGQEVLIANNDMDLKGVTLRSNEEVNIYDSVEVQDYINEHNLIAINVPRNVA